MARSCRLRFSQPRGLDRQGGCRYVHVHFAFFLSRCQRRLSVKTFSSRTPSTLEAGQSTWIVHAGCGGRISFFSAGCVADGIWRCWDCYSSISLSSAGFTVTRDCDVVVTEQSSAQTSSTAEDERVGPSLATVSAALNATSATRRRSKLHYANDYSVLFSASTVRPFCIHVCSPSACSLSLLSTPNTAGFVLTLDADCRILE